MHATNKTDWVKRHEAYKRQQKKLSRKKLADFLFENRSHRRALNVGAGSQDVSLYFPNVMTQDLSPRRKADFVCDAADMKDVIVDNSFDIVLCLSVLEHTQQPEKVIQEMYRILTPGGVLLLSVPFVFPLHDCPHDYWRFTKYGLWLLLKQFEQVDITESMNTMETCQYLFYRLSIYTTTKYIRRGARLLFRSLESLFSILKNALERQQTLSFDGQLIEESHLLVSDYYVVARKKA